jgi:hypothetical protein
MAITSLVGANEIYIGAGLVLVSIGCWLVWRPAAFLVPGAVLLWMALPARLPFIVDPRKPRREEP